MQVLYKVVSLIQVAMTGGEVNRLPSIRERLNGGTRKSLQLPIQECLNSGGHRNSLQLNSLETMGSGT